MWIRWIRIRNTASSSRVYLCHAPLAVLQLDHGRPEGLVGAVGEGPGPQPLHRCPHVLRQAGQELAQRARSPDTELNKGGRLQIEQVEALVAEEGVLQDDLNRKLSF